MSTIPIKIGSGILDTAVFPIDSYKFFTILGLATKSAGRLSVLAFARFSEGMRPFHAMYKNSVPAELATPLIFEK